MSLEIVTIVGGPIQTNAYLVADTATGDALVIDAPYETASQIVEEAARRGWTIGQIVITHTHWDHILDARALQEATGVPLLAHPLAREPLANPAANFGEPPVEIPPVEVSGTIDDGDTVTLGDIPSPSCICPGTIRRTSVSSTPVPRAKRCSSVVTFSSPVGTARRRSRAPIKPSPTRRCAASPPSCRRQRR